MTPLQHYLEYRTRDVITEDAEQLKAMQQLEMVYQQLLLEHRHRQSLYAWLRKPRLVPGLYLWGGVGIGKTFMMDCFYQSIPFPEKMRMHFHQFMRLIHAELKKHQGQKNPLQIIARNLAQKTLLLCFDELFVTDITDAMLLGRLLRALFDQGVTLIATSNVMPDDLYKRGLQRPLFVPAIEALKKHMTVWHVPTKIDYRLRYLKDAGVFYTPNDAVAEQKMEKSFAVLTTDQVITYDAIEICGRSIPIKKQASDTVWFDFNVICAVPRSQQDYLAIAEKYRNVFISNVPVIPPEAKDRVTLLIRLVDIFYDARIRLVLSAAANVAQLYREGSMLFEYHRTSSRLLEMQSEAYLQTQAID